MPSTPTPPDMPHRKAAAPSVVRTAPVEGVQPACTAAPPSVQTSGPNEGVEPLLPGRAGIKPVCDEADQELVGRGEVLHADGPAPAAGRAASLNVAAHGDVQAAAPADADVEFDNGGTVVSSSASSSGPLMFDGMPIPHWRCPPNFLQWMAYQMSLPRAERYSEEGVPPLVSSSEPSDANDESDESRSV